MNDSSVSGKDWISKNYNEDTVNFLKDNFNLSEIVSKLIAIRKINLDEVKLFLNPKIKNSLPNPFTLKDIEKTVDITIDGILKKEKFGVFGDYDVDGATSTAILGNYFNEITHKVEIYIPDRKTEGYGPSKQGFNTLIESGSKLIFTVDCGTLSFDTIEFSQKKILTF